MSKNLPKFILLSEGGRITVHLKDGVTLGGLHLTVAHVRQLSAGDILDAQEEAERLVYTADGGMALVMSPARMARASLRRQVVKLDDDELRKHDGPLSTEELNMFSMDDFSRLQSAATLLDRAAELPTEKQAVAGEKRGRSTAGSAAHAPAAGTGSPQGGD